MKPKTILAIWLFALAVSFGVLVGGFSRLARGQDLVITEVLSPIDRDLITARDSLPRTPTLAPARCDCGCEHEALCDCPSCPNKLVSVVDHRVVDHVFSGENKQNVTKIDVLITTPSTKPSSPATGRAAGLATPARQPVAKYDSAGSPVVPAPVPDDMLALNGPIRKLVAKVTPKAAANLTPTVHTPQPVPSPSPQKPQPQGYWARSCSGGSCYSYFVPNRSAPAVQQYRQPVRRGLFRRW